MLPKPIPREAPQEALCHTLVPAEKLNENITGTFIPETAADLGIERVWRTVVDRKNLIDSETNADICYKRVPVARVSMLDGNGEPK